MHTRAITILQGVIVVRVISWSIYETLGHETPKGLVVLRCSVHLGIPFGEGVSTPITNGPCTGGRLRARIDDGQCKLTRGGTAVSLCNFHLTRVGKCKYEDNDFRNIGDAEKQYSGNLACPLIGALGYLPFCCSNVNCTDTLQPIRTYYIHIHLSTKIRHIEINFGRFRRPLFHPLERQSPTIHTIRTQNSIPSLRKQRTALQNFVSSVSFEGSLLSRLTS